MGRRSLEALKIAFTDEDTATWTAAAREIGVRAVKDAEARAFIAHWLARDPASAAEGEANIHRFRHACCALASYASRAEPVADDLSAQLERHVVGPLVNLAFVGLKAAGGTVGDLARIPGLSEALEGWVEAQRVKLQATISKLEAKGQDRGVAANRAKLEALDGLEDATPVPAGFDPELPGLLPHAPWALASFFAGVRTLKAFGGVPLDLLVQGALQLGRARKGSGLPFVLGLPDVLLAVKAEVEPEVFSAMVEAVLAVHEPGWPAERLHYNEWVLSRAKLPGAGDLRSTFERGFELSTALSAQLDGLARADGREVARQAARVMRTIATTGFSDDWAWEEQTPDERFALNVFAMLAVKGPAPWRAEDARPDKSMPRLSHRIALVLVGLHHGVRAREHVVPTLVRCLKLLLYEELQAHIDRADLADVCRRQVALVRPLVAEWRLPRTLRKDLAIIVCRVLLATFRKDRAAFVELFYHVLYALPDEVLFREIIEYSSEPELSELVEHTVALVSAAHADAPPEALMPLYETFAGALAKIAEDAPRVAWTARLGDLAAFLGRVSGEDGAPPMGSLELEATLQSVLRCRGDLGADWGELASDRREDKKGASWAAREAARRDNQLARGTLDRFSRLLDDLQVLESDCLPEVGRPTPSDDLARRWRRLISTLDELSALSSEALPFLEREVVVAQLDARIERLERRLLHLVRIIEQEDEAAAVAVLERRAAEDEADEGADEHDLVHEDARLVQEWMLGRYMVSELARVMKLKTLRALTNPAVVALWVLLPFLACMGLHAAGLTAWAAAPFGLVTVANVGVLLLYGLEARRTGALAAGAGRYLLPQITAALFLGINEVLASDESWSLAVLEYGAVRLFTVLAFLAAGFFFIREVLLGSQLKGRAEARAKSRRASSVMALIVWQSALLVNLFGTLGGRVMGLRAGLDLGHLGAPFGLPNEVGLAVLGASFRVFPWALVTWTVQVFFFSAIFERIMRSQD